MQLPIAVQRDESNPDEIEAGDKSADGSQTTEPSGGAWDGKELGESRKEERDA